MTTINKILDAGIHSGDEVSIDIKIRHEDDSAISVVYNLDVE